LQVSPDELRAPLLAAIKSAAAVRNLVLRGDVAEEEDFVPSIHGLNLQDHFSEVEVAKQLNAAEEELQAAPPRPPPPSPLPLPAAHLPAAYQPWPRRRRA
jgi:hypothetical protein